MQRYAITGGSLLPDSPEAGMTALRARVSAWAQAGVEWIQVREKNMPEDALEALVWALVPLVQMARSGTRLVVNGLPVQAALDCGADGVHLTGGASAEAMQAAHRAGAVVSVSCHTPADLAQARAGAADAVLWAPVFSKMVQGTEVSAGTGLDPLKLACEAAMPAPVFALGGVTAGNAGSCVQAGAAGVAGIRLFEGNDWRELGLS